MSPQRAKRLLAALEWRQSDFLRRLNRVARTVYTPDDAAEWFNGVRSVPTVVSVFLKLSLRNDRETRRLLRLHDFLPGGGC